MRIPFVRPYVVGNEIEYIKMVIDKGAFCGDGTFSKQCAAWLEASIGCKKAILTPSGTSALEMMFILANIGVGDEVIMPSFTFSSTANAVVLRGATPVFVDIRPETLNIDAKQIEAAITPRTRAICPVHYAGVACDMDAILALARQYNLLVLPDAAQAIMSKYNGRSLCGIGEMTALSFHDTKNIQCGEGGALIINDASFVERAEIVMEKGTDRSKFFRGEIDKYTWVDVGSSFLMNEITAAFLWAQLEAAEEITAQRLALWNTYHEALAPLEQSGILRRPAIPTECEQNAHIYFVLLNDEAARNAAMDKLRSHGISAVFHYIPLDTAVAGKKYGLSKELPVTADISQRLLRLPLAVEMGRSEVSRVVEVMQS